MPRRRRSSRSRTTPTPLPAGGGLAAGVAKEAQLTEASLPNGHSARRRSSPKIAGTASPESSSPGSSDAQDVLVDALGNSFSRSRKPHKSPVEPTPADVPDWAFIPRGDFPRDEREREVLDRLLRAHAASTRRRSLGFREELPYDMLYGCAAPPRAPSLRPPAAPPLSPLRRAPPSSFVRGAAPKEGKLGTPRHAPRPTPRTSSSSSADAWEREAFTCLQEALHRLDEMQLDRTAPAVARLESEAHFEDCWRARELGRDKDGRLVMLDHVGGINFDGIHKLSHDDILRNYAHRFERIRRRKLALAREIGVDAYYHTTVVDLKGLGLGHVRRENREIIKAAFKFSSVCYPESVHRIYLINAPAVFQIAWRGVQKWVDPITAKKIQVLGKDYEAKFKELLPGVDVPESSRWEADPHDC